MTTTTFSRYIAQANYDKYLAVNPAPYGPMLLTWMKSWSKEQRQWIFNHFAIHSEDGRLVRLQGMDIRPYLADIAYQISMVKGVSVITGASMHDEQLELALC